MKITFDHGVLSAALRRAVHVVARMNTIPILANVLIYPNDALGVSLMTTDMERVFNEAVPAAVEGEGKITVDARRLLALLKGGQGEVVISHGGGDAPARVACDGLEAALPTLPADDFPHMNVSNGSRRSFCWKVGELMEVLRFVQPAISTEETRYYLNGIYLHEKPAADDGRLWMVTTDGHRLHLAPAPEMHNYSGSRENKPLSLIIPRQTIAYLMNLLGNGQGEVRVTCYGEMKITFAHEGWILTTKLIDGTFPDYSRVIPQFHAGALDLLTIHRPDRFLNFLQRVGAISLERSKPVKLVADYEKGNRVARMILEVRDPEGGVAKVALPVEVASMALATAAKEPSYRGFQVRYLKDALKVLPKGMEWHFKADDGGTSPTTLSSGERSVTLMPMRV